MEKEQFKMKFQCLMNELGFITLQEDEYSLKYQNDKVYIQMFFGRLTEKPDIFIRFEDGEIPEQYNMSSMLFLDDLNKGVNSLSGIEDVERLDKLINYFANNHKSLLKKKNCKYSKIKLNKYIDETYHR
ncbi:hypothetical protein SH1V18_34640 [Vallitalea longa]|uniref:Uncharacterized protein n=1 Tax=Vallitalea longa TaxID=2936439 RepID=A0A9W5YFH5_9FIRM|nr:hypothetical protein [Vallitalea longa]GKX30984.1 hypothetical protein SH1V18_34640 [Vallitalea longa]